MATKKKLSKAMTEAEFDNGWKELKKLNIPKSYQAWKEFRGSRQNSGAAK